MSDATAEPIRIVYRTVALRARADGWGRAMRSIAARPWSAGLIAGLFGVALAWLASPGGVAAAPELAAGLAAAVVALWMLGVRSARPFFARQGSEEIEVRRTIEAGPGALLWIEDDARELAHIPDPVYAIEAASRFAGGSTRRARIIARGPNDRVFRLECAAPSAEASRLAYSPGASDEELPWRLAAPLWRAVAEGALPRSGCFADRLKAR